MRVIVGVLLSLFLLTVPLKASAFEGEVFMDASATSLSSGDVLRKTAYTLSAEVRHNIGHLTPYALGEVDFDSTFDETSYMYEVGVELSLSTLGKGFIIRGGYSEEGYPSGSEERLYKVGVGFRF